MQRVRNAVKENTLSNPDLIKEADYKEYIGSRGTGWVAEVAGRIVGFAIVDMREHNVWALFLLPEYERQGIGRTLHDTMLDWYFGQTTHTLWLSTAPGTRAAAFYRAAGWQETGTYGKGEIKFEMEYSGWDNY